MAIPSDTTGQYSSQWLSALLDAVGLTPSVIIEAGAEKGLAKLEGYPTARRVSLAGDRPPSVASDESPGEKEGASTVFVNCVVEGQQGDSWWVREVAASDASGGLPDYWVRTGRGAPAEVLRAVVELCSKGQIVAALVPTQVLRGSHAVPLRAWLAREHGVDWLVFVRSAASVMPVHPIFEVALIVLRVGAGGSKLLRLVELGDPNSERWRKEIALVRKRQGGEVGHGIVLRDPNLGGEAWTYKRFTKNFRETVDDARGLGPLRKLGEFFGDVRRGIHQARVQELEIEPDLFTEAEGGIPCFSARSIDASGIKEPTFWVRGGDVPEEMKLRAGDCLLHSIMPPAPGQRFSRAALTRTGDLPATYDHTIIRLRPNLDVSLSMMELVVSFLNSSHFSEMLLAHGADLTLSITRLKDLEVPVPSSDVMDAFDRLSASEAKYEAWAEQCRQARSSIHMATSYSAAVERLLSQEQLDFERVSAAEESQTFAYRVRNYYPYPIALRRELIRQLDHDQDRLDKTLLCAEHAMNLLALASMVQLAGEHDLGEEIPSEAMKSFVRDGTLSMDWGRAEAVVREGLARTVRTKDPLSLPFPAFVRLTETSDDSFVAAERRLREIRNSTRHLEEIPPSDLKVIAQRATEDLDVLLGALGVFVVTPLVVIDDYRMDPTTRHRYVTVRILRGASQAFRIEQKIVEREVPRGAVGFLDHAGLFRSLSPWLVMKTCPKCRREELFLFNRYERGTAKYVAMESGHASTNTHAANTFDPLIGV